jgi:hypothetical protein
MKSYNDTKLSHQIHKLLYKKQQEINEMLSKQVVDYCKLKRAREDLTKLEAKFIKHKTFERECEESNPSNT